VYYAISPRVSTSILSLRNVTIRLQWWSRSCNELEDTCEDNKVLFSLTLHQPFIHACQNLVEDSVTVSARDKEGVLDTRASDLMPKKAIHAAAVKIYHTSHRRVPKDESQVPTACALSSDLTKLSK